jgi:hypothetical protein
MRAARSSRSPSATPKLRLLKQVLKRSFPCDMPFWHISPQPYALANCATPRDNIFIIPIYSYAGRSVLTVTFGDPETSSIKTSFKEKFSLRYAFLAYLTPAVRASQLRHTPRQYILLQKTRYPFGFLLGNPGGSPHTASSDTEDIRLTHEVIIQKSFLDIGLVTLYLIIGLIV